MPKPRRTRAGGRAGAPKSKKLVAAVQKKAKTEAKLQAKKESKVGNHFQKAMNCFFERTIQEDRQYVLTMVAENDAWIPRLAALFRSGAMKQLLEAGESAVLGSHGESSGDDKWKGKVYRILALPLKAKLCMVKPFVKL